MAQWFTLLPSVPRYPGSIPHGVKSFFFLINYQVIFDNFQNHIVLGTDYPFPLGELEVGKVVEEYQPFSALDRDNLLWKNAIQMLNLDENTLFDKNF